MAAALDTATTRFSPVMCTHMLHKLSPDILSNWGCTHLSLATVTDSLGLPAAPILFEGIEALPYAINLPLLPFLSMPRRPTGPPPDPDKLYCPEGCELYKYQEDGLQYLLTHPVCLLGDEMGLGKSIQTIAALRLLINRGEVKRALIMCPKTLVNDWLTKLVTWAPDVQLTCISGKKKFRVWSWQCTHVPISLVAYETFREDLKKGVADPTGFDMVILDEAQRIKNPERATHLAVAQITAKWRWGLSGTPLENQVRELVGIFQYLVPGLLPNAKAILPHQVPKIVAPYVLRRCKADVLKHLPPKEHQVVWLELNHFQRVAYDREKNRIRAEGSADGYSNILEKINRLKQICNLDPASGASCKMTFLEQELDRICQEDDKVLVYSQYPVVTLKRLMPRLERFTAWLFDGSLSDFNRQMMMHIFQSQELPKVMAMSLKAGGVGLTLTRANHVYHFDSWWNPATAAQAEDRAHRIGQKKIVYVTTMMTKGTIEERIFNLMNQKRELFRQVMDPLTDKGDDERAISKLISKEDMISLLK